VLMREAAKVQPVTHVTHQSRKHFQVRHDVSCLSFFLSTTSIDIDHDMHDNILVMVLHVYTATKYSTLELRK
jgi:hypothetical protein